MLRTMSQVPSMHQAMGQLYEKHKPAFTDPIEAKVYINGTDYPIEDVKVHINVPPAVALSAAGLGRETRGQDVD